MISETDLLSRFDGVKRTGDRNWMVLCPAHEDQNPSLHLTHTDERWLLHCHAGCDIDAIREVIGLTSSDLASSQNGNGSRREIAAYPYVDEDGRLLFEVVRFDPKDFRQRQPSGEWHLKGVRRVLYRLPQVLDGVRTGKQIWIAEGEKDVHSLERAGRIATCNPMGAGKGKWRDEYTRALVGAKIVIVADDDEPGEDHATRIRTALEGVAASIVVVKPAAGFKDASDHLRAGKTVAEFVRWEGGPVAQPLENQGGPGHQDRYAGRILDVERMMAEPTEPIPWRCDRLAADGYLTVLAGRGGEGKSWLALALACGVARGTPAAGIECTKGRALIFDAENGPRLTIQRFRAARVTGDLHVQPVDAGGLRVTGDLPWFKEVIEEQRANLVVFDSLRVLSSGTKENDGDALEPIVTALKQLARETAAAIVLVHHRGKSDTSEYRGSSVILDQTDLLFTLSRVNGDDDGRHRRKLASVKCRIDEEPEERWVRIWADRERELVYVDEAEPYEEAEYERPRDARRDDVLAVLSERPKSERQIAKDSQVSRTTVQRLLGDLRVEGLADRTQEGWVAHQDSIGSGPPGPPPEIPSNDGRFRVAHRGGPPPGPPADAGPAGPPPAATPSPTVCDGCGAALAQTPSGLICFGCTSRNGVAA